MYPPTGVCLVVAGGLTQDLTLILSTKNTEQNKTKKRKPKQESIYYKIYKRHSEGSKAKVNEDKTQIFRLGEKGNEAAERDAGIHDKVYSKVTILGAKFCKDKKRETAENLKKANGLLEKIKASTEYYYLGIVGKILKINTYIYTTIYNNAFLMNTSSKDFQDFIKRVSTYIQRIKSSEVYEKVAREREAGGLGLINIKERIKAIKARDLIEIEEEIIEKDHLFYELGTKQHIVAGRISTGPKAEIIRKDLKHIIKDIEKSQEDIVNYRTRKKKIKASDMHKILYPKEKTLIPNTIFIPENPKSISINYLVTYEILPVHSSMTCKFCRTEKESINHLLLECNGLLNVREMTDELLRAANSSFQKNRILRMENISCITEAIVISKYEGTIWNVRNALMRGAKHNEERTAEKVRKNIDSHLRRMQATIK